MCSVSIAIVSPSASRSRLTTTICSPGETFRNRPRRAPASCVFIESVRLPGTIPRRRMSSLNEVMVSSWEIFGCWT